MYLLLTHDELWPRFEGEVNPTQNLIQFLSQRHFILRDIAISIEVVALTLKTLTFQGAK
jgi:hypothetical protein